MLLAFGGRYLLLQDEWQDGYPFLLFFPAIILAAMLFDRGSGLYAVALAATLADYFVIVPTGSFAVARLRDLMALAVFVISGLATALLIEAFHKIYCELSVVLRSLQAAHRDLTEALESVRSSERQKDVLMQELTHRTKTT